MPDINHPIIDGRLTPAPPGGDADPASNDDGDRPAPDLEDRAGGTPDRVQTGRRSPQEDTVARLRENTTAAANAIARLAQRAGSEAVRLRAARAVLADLMEFENYASLESRLTALERGLRGESRSFEAPNRSDQVWPATTGGVPR